MAKKPTSAKDVKASYQPLFDGTDPTKERLIAEKIFALRHKRSKSQSEAHATTPTAEGFADEDPPATPPRPRRQIDSKLVFIDADSCGRPSAGAAGVDNSLPPETVFLEFADRTMPGHPEFRDAESGQVGYVAQDLRSAWYFGPPWMFPPTAMIRFATNERYVECFQLDRTLWLELLPQADDERLKTLSRYGAGSKQLQTLYDLMEPLIDHAAAMNW